ncbi:MAG: hypothetical protein HY816_04905 [Candidatus Wallbacteria bacterium]|nr:hypothetical protein [Candidatus Wallbacteria bacterium]
MRVGSAAGSVRARGAFTVVEISVAAFILALVFLMGFTFLTGEGRGVAQMTQDLDINATVEAAFSQLSRDVRASSEVLTPGLIDVKDAPPRFEYGKTSLCVLKQSYLDCRSTPVSRVSSVVKYWLDKPVRVGDLPGGEVGVTYSLYRRVNDQPGSDPEKPILTGIQELTFYRTKKVPGAAGPNGTGYYVLHMNMKVAALRRGTGSYVFRGYAAQMDTMVKLRGGL